MARRGVSLRGRTWRLVAVVALLALWGGSVLAQSPGRGDDAYQFAEAVIWSLGDAHLADTRMQDATQTLEAQLVALRVAADDLRRAAVVIGPFTTSQDTFIRDPAQLIRTTYIGLARSHDETAGDVLRLLDEAIETQAVALSTYALLEPPAQPDEPYKRLRLTADQRTALLRELERSFGRDVMTSEKLLPGTSWAQGAGKAVYKFLSDTAWPSLDTK